MTDHPQPAEQRKTSRVTQLDGLRGIAALVVVFSHLALTTSGLANAWLDRSAKLTPMQYGLVYSPLHLLWNGTAAVYVFFVLSGFVLVLPVAKAAGSTDWGSYYAKRLLRLYLPVWGSLVFASLLLVVVPHVSAGAQTWWVQNVTVAWNPLSVAHDGVLLLPTGLTNAPLWSLRWEVVFSLLLPLYALFALRLRRLWPAKVVIVLVAVFLGGLLSQEWLFYLPIFALGAFIAVEHQAIVALAKKTPRAISIGLAIVAILTLNAVWFSRAQIPGTGAIPAVGAGLAVMLFVAWPPAIRLGNLTVSRWLGRVSFSLYLVHYPIVLASAWLLRPVSPYLSVFAGLVLALVFAEVFYRFVERPAHKLAIAAGQRVRRGAAPVNLPR